MTNHGQGAAPGWYPTPDGRQRYWDGRQWTEHVAPLATPHPYAAPQQDRRAVSRPDTKPGYAKKLLIIPFAVVGVLFFLWILGSFTPDREPTEQAQPVSPPATTQSVAPATSSPTPEDETSTLDSTAEPEATRDSRLVDVSTVDACLSLMEPLQKANLAMLKIAEESSNDPQSAVDMWRALSVEFEDFGKVAANAEVAALSAAVGEDGHALTDAMEKVYVNNDFSVMTEFMTANDAFWQSYTELLELCDTAQ